MPAIFNKPVFTQEEQCQKILSVGNLIDPDNLLPDLILNNGYYRIKSYIKPFLNKSFSVTQLAELLNFDNTLRILLFQAIGELEVYFRTTLSESMSLKRNDPFWYLDTSLFSMQNQEKILSTVITETERSKEDFIVNYKNTYQSPSLSQSLSHIKYQHFPPS